MERYQKIYRDYFGDKCCELTGVPFVHVHHIESRGMGSKKSVDVIENLMALSPDAHEYFGDKKQFKDFLIEVHLKFMEDKIPLYQYNPGHPILIEFLKRYGKIRMNF